MSTPVLENLSPFQVLFHQVPNYTFFRTFGYAYWPYLRPISLLSPLVWPTISQSQPLCPAHPSLISNPLVSSLTETSSPSPSQISPSLDRNPSPLPSPSSLASSSNPTPPRPPPHHPMVTHSKPNTTRPLLRTNGTIPWPKPKSHVFLNIFATTPILEEPSSYVEASRYAE